MIWVDSMVIAGLELSETSYEDLIDHMENLERSLSDELIPRKD